MQKKNRRTGSELQELRTRASSAEEALESIRSGAVDAVVVSGPAGDRVFTLHGTEHAYRIFVEAMNEGAATVAFDGTILYGNRCFADLVGKPLDKVIGTSVFDLIPPAEKDTFEAFFRNSLASSSKVELNLRTAAGDLVPVYVSGKSFEEFGSRALCMVITDLSEQKRNEQLLAAGRLARRIVDQATEVIAVCDYQGRIIQASLALQLICGRSPLLERFDDCLRLRIEAPEKREEGPKYFSVTDPLQGRIFRGVEVSYQSPRGEIMNFLLSAGPITHGPEEADGCVVTLFDIGERKRAEESLRRSERMAATGRLAATIAHEINNPLEGVTNLLYLIETMPGLSPEALRYANAAQQELGRVAHITRQTLTFYRESSHPRPVDLKELLESILALYSGKLDAKSITLKKELIFQGQVMGFQNQLAQVFSNVLLNAVEASPPKGRLRIRLYASREWANSKQRGVRIVIADTGSGIRSEDRSKLFEPFFTTKGEGGTGLGLWVSQGIIQRHHGFMRFRSRAGRKGSGTVFSIFVPIDPAPRSPSS